MRIDLRAYSRGDVAVMDCRLLALGLSDTIIVR
jgi:hypothetical protein